MILRLRTLLAALTLAQFAWGDSAQAQIVPSEAASDGLAKNECLSSAAAPDAAAPDAGVSWCYTNGAYTSLSATATPAPYIGARSDPGSVDHPIDVWEICRYVDNLSKNSYFVPFNTLKEWSAFIDNAPVSRSLDTRCSRATQWPVDPEAVCTHYTPVSPPPAFALPYARNGGGDPTADQTIPTSYTCRSNPAGCVGGIGNAWTETATQTFAPGISTDGQLADSGWSPVPDTLSYDGTPAPVCTPGQCGAANGVATTSAPTTGLCSAGTATEVSGSGPWSWSCDGINNGTTASCAAGDITVPVPVGSVECQATAPSAAGITNTIYVNNHNSCPGSGTSQSPYCSIQNALNVARPGTDIRIQNSGSAYNETDTLSTSGTASNPIVIESDTPSSPATLTNTTSTATWSYQLELNGAAYVTIQNLVWNGTGLNVAQTALQLECSAGSNPAGINILNNSFINWAASNTTISYLDTGNQAIWFQANGTGCTAPLVQCNTFTGVRRTAIEFWATSGGSILNNTITGTVCGAVNAGQNGGNISVENIHCAGGTSPYTGNMLIQGNTIANEPNNCSLSSWPGYYEEWSGFHADSDCSGGTINQNQIYGLQGTSNGSNVGLHIEWGAVGWTVENNLIYNLSSPGWWWGIFVNPQVSGAQNLVYNNTVYNTNGIGIIWVEDAAVENNISFNNATAQFGWLNGNAPSSSSNYNLGFGGSAYGWIGGSSVGLAAWQSETGGDANSINSNPNLSNPGAGTAVGFEETASSPTLGAGVTIPAVATDFLRATRTPAYDIGAFQGVGGGSPGIPEPPPTPSNIPPPPAQSSITSAYYVNCSLGGGGSGTEASPFGSLAQAQEAMESSSIKTAIVSGTCTLGGNWNLTSADSGETWEAACGQVTTIDGGVTQTTIPVGGCGEPRSITNGYLINVNGANNLAFYGFTFNNLASGLIGGWDQGGGLLVAPALGFDFRWNTFNNCNMACIEGAGVGSSIIDSNTINGVSDGYPAGFDITVTEPTDGLCYVPAAIEISGGGFIPNFSLGNDYVTNNLIENAQGGGITFEGNNDVIGNNVILNSGTELFDGGAIYTSDPASVETGNQIINNEIINFGGTAGANADSNWTSAIYLDGAGGALISGNVLNGSGLALHVLAECASNTTIENNVVDLSSGGLVGVDMYNSVRDCSQPQTGNSFEHNIIYTSGSFSSQLWSLCCGGPSPDTRVTDTSNLYYSASGTPIFNNGMVDSNPVDANPGFADPSAGNYSMPSNSPAYAAGFQPLSTNRGPSLNPVCPSGY